ncbi:SpoIIE family protein phosphatase [uncultured Microscilla sp.]|uniref:PP2C family protein-serine/threonine phosphatase n=1 Tax=uncultured Microscilla sp. TaxID=432653 RepID=UPI0026172997|nr:SpoIIE family protein phosphatase [uncultured Microscilla sp.]
MFKQFHTIRSKLLFYFAIFLVLTFTIILTNFWFDKRKDTIDAIAARLQNINLNTQIISRLESEFFKDEIINPQFYKTHQSTYLTQRDSLVDRVRTDLKNLAKTHELASTEVANNIEDIVAQYQRYDTIFSNIITLIQFRGFKNYGIEGKMRQYIHQAEDSSKVHLYDQSHILMIRRYEKDFILRKQPMYIAKVKKAVKALQGIVKKEVWPTKVKYQLTLDLQNYLELFDKLTAAEAAIGFRNNMGLRQQLKLLAKAMNSNLATLNQVVRQRSHRLERQITATLVLIMAFCVGLIVLLGYTITRMLSRPIRQLSASIGEVIRSGFSHDRSLLRFDTKDEIGLLSKDFAYMLDTVHFTMDEIKQKSAKVEEKQALLMDSLRYAKQIQQAILPEYHEFENVFKDYFVLFLAQQVVSGDFYWLLQRGNKTFVAVVDCTGHGVPGAFMSMIGNTLLNEIVNEKNVEEPALILEVLHLEIRTALRQAQKKNDDGMDVCLCLIEQLPQSPRCKKVTFAGARRPLLYSVASVEPELLNNPTKETDVSAYNATVATIEKQITANKEPTTLHIIKGTKRSIGGVHHYENRPFLNHQVILPENTVLYLTTDGYADQHNPQREKYSRQRLYTFIETIARMPLGQQKKALNNELEQHMVDAVPQRDDITIVGIKL